MYVHVHGPWDLARVVLRLSHPVSLFGKPRQFLSETCLRAIPKSLLWPLDNSLYPCTALWVANVDSSKPTCQCQVAVELSILQSDKQRNV